MKSISILDQEYTQWVKDLSIRYRQAQIRAAVKVNEEMLRFNYYLGRDIVNMHIEDRWGDRVISQLSADLKNELPGIGLSKTNIYYCKKFYLLYNQHVEIFQQVDGKIHATDSDEIFQQTAELFRVPWGHHCLIMDKLKGDLQNPLMTQKNYILPK